MANTFEGDALAHDLEAQVLFYCRPGLENDCAAEAIDKAAEAGIYGYAKTEPNLGYVRFMTHVADDSLRMVDDVPFDSWIFPRQIIHVTHELKDLPVHDRISALAEAAESWPELEAVWLEYPDTNEGKQITRLTKKLEKGLLGALRSQQTLCPSSQGGVRGHVFWLSGSHVVLGLSAIDNSAPWLLGYPRLRLPKQSPSRSTLKLDEAWLQLVSDVEMADMFKSGYSAVDLGSAPGGWTWQLVNKGLKVFAVDNGPMDDALMASGRVTHLRADAFTYKPKRPVEWMVCDIVDKPARVQQLMLRWLLQGWCRFTVFNLKLPMKQRWKTAKKLLAEIGAELQKAGFKATIRAKQLYHDREEITVFVALQ